MKRPLNICRNVWRVLMTVITSAATTTVDKIVVTLSALCLGVALVFKAHTQQRFTHRTVSSKPLCQQQYYYAKSNSRNAPVSYKPIAHFASGNIKKPSHTPTESIEQLYTIM